ncbi:MAG: NAD(P)/FAD-dependent oxidoreductase, partial [Mycobacteriales bacterium]
MSSRNSDDRGPAQLLLVGGGYVGLYTALGLQRRLRLRAGEAVVTVVDPEGYMTYQPFLPEAAAGSLEPRHVVVSLRRVLPKCRIITGSVVSLEHAQRAAVVHPGEGEPYELRYDQVVVAPGSVPRTLPIPGLAEVGIGFTTVEEAVYLRNYVLSRMDTAAAAVDARLRARALTFLFVGGGYAGVEALAELEDMARDACRYYRGVRPEDMRWVLVESASRILPDVSDGMGRYTVQALRRRGIEVRLDTRVESLTGGHVRLSDGTEFDAETVVWTAGVRPHPMLADTDLPLDERGRVRTEATLQVTGAPGAWAAGDAAAVPDLTKEPGTVCAPTAQHAVRQAKVLADNLVRDLRGQQLRSYRHAYAG